MIAPVLEQHGPVAVGLGYRAKFTLEAPVDGVAVLALRWTPGIPDLRDCPRIYAKYSKERDKFLKRALRHADISVIQIEVLD